MKNFFVLSLLSVLLFEPGAEAAIVKGNNTHLKKTAGTSGFAVSNTYIDINNVKALESNVGFSDYNLNTLGEGLEWPKGSGKTVIYESGFLWGGYVPGDPQVRVGGSAYLSGLQPGPILSNGHAADPTDPRWRIYRVRPDVFLGGPLVDLSAEAKLENTTSEALRSQYEWDWMKWPAAGTSNNLGAPFTDVNHDGIYEPNIDIPGVPGADQTVYFVANDEDSTLTKNLYGTLPLGIEVHATYWAYEQKGALGNMYFKKYTIINKGYQHYTIDSMFVSFWADPDIGYPNNDLVGTDNKIPPNLIYAYNGYTTDTVYFPEVPPSVGFVFLKGPEVNGQDLPMYASYAFIPLDQLDLFSDPIQREPRGSTQFYNYFKGLDNFGDQIINPVTAQPTRFIFNGDPVKHTGWIDSSFKSPFFGPNDVRQGMSSGPFTFAPGDTQSVVFAEMVGQGSDYLHSIYKVKSYWYDALNTYKNLVNISGTPVPPSPSFSISNKNDSIQIQWDSSADNFSKAGYSFEGYNIYQLSSPYIYQDTIKLIAVCDKIDGVKTIYDSVYDPQTGQLEYQAQQFGTDSGIKHEFTPAKDYIDNSPFIKGKNYYYAVTAYTYNPGSSANPTNTESPLEVQTISFNHEFPGPNYGDTVQVIHTAGKSNAVIKATVTDPSKLTGDKYEVTFHNETYMLGQNGVWTDITSASKKLFKTADLTGSKISSKAVYADKKGSINIHYLVNVVSPNYDWCDGVKITLPASVTIDNIYKPISNNTGGEIPYTFDQTTNSIFYGEISLDSLIHGDTTNRSQFGIFAGGEDIVITVHPATLPIITNYTMYDDDWGDNNGYYVGLKDVSGTDTLNGPISNQYVTQHQWNVTDLTTGKLVLKNQTIYSDSDIYAPDYFFAKYGIYGPGGSSGSRTEYVSINYDSIFDGIRVDVDGSYHAPASIGSVIMNVKPGSNFNIKDFTYFGYPNATANTTLKLYNGNVTAGTTDSSSLVQNYELKWTGITGDTTINGHTVLITKSGGSYATLFGASYYNLASHPLNPHSGSDNPFLIRIPFEVWNINKNEQVNLLVYDRNFNQTNDPSKDGFEVWNENDRMYTWVVNTKYSQTVISPTSRVVKDSATWNWAFFKSVFTTGDDIKIIYNNPLQIGVDKYVFTAPDSIKYIPPPTKGKITKFFLSQNFPNPFNPSTTIEYNIPKTVLVQIKVYDILGQKVATLVNEVEPAGSYSVIFNAGKFASGVYFYQLRAGNYVAAKKILLLK